MRRSRLSRDTAIHNGSTHCKELFGWKCLSDTLVKKSARLSQLATNGTTIFISSTHPHTKKCATFYMLHPIVMFRIIANGYGRLIVGTQSSQMTDHNLRTLARERENRHALLPWRLLTQLQFQLNTVTAQPWPAS